MQPADFHEIIDDVAYRILAWRIGIPESMAEECETDLYDVWCDLPEATRARYESLYLQLRHKEALGLYLDRRMHNGNSDL